jgi:hypothetical protein
MKKIYAFLAAILFTAISFAQAPEKMSYQAVVRDSGDALVTNQPLGMQISILQGSTSGTAVYTETQIPTTNVNGLVTLEIGTGTTSDNFSAIDWSSGPYFIKTEIDPSGGTNYSITGASQLLSVPYSLQANELTGGIDKAYINSLEAYINSLEARLNILEDRTPKEVGDYYAGGVVFWVDPTDNTHGLVCAIEDQSTGIQWWNGSNIDIVGTQAGLGSGSVNTDAIIAAQGAVETSYAAGIARAYTGGGYNNWYLPSSDELALMENNGNKEIINTTATNNGGSVFNDNGAIGYWASDQFQPNEEFAGWRSFNSTGQGYASKDNLYAVRAVRAF